jgi:hypothetical protein
MCLCDDGGGEYTYVYSGGTIYNTSIYVVEQRKYKYKQLATCISY